MGEVSKIALLPAVAATEPLASVFRRYQPSLVRLLTRRLRNPAAAEDLAQEAFLQLSDTAGRIENAEAYLTRTALNLANNHTKSQARQANLQANTEALFWYGADTPNPERALIAAQDLKQAVAVFDALPERTQLILELVRLEGLSTHQVAARLGISMRAVRKHLERATRRLSVALNRP